MMDEARFKTFFEQTSKPLLSYLLRVTNDTALSDDVFQESYIRLLQADVKDPTDVKLKSYLFTTSTNLVRDRWRLAKRTVAWENEGPGDLETTREEDQVSVRFGLEQVFNGVSAQQRSLLWLAYVEGYEHKEIAAMLNLKEKSVRVLLFRAKQKASGILTALGMQKEDV